MLKGKHIILGITGSIAAYKSAVLCRLLVSAGAEVKVVMTPLAKQFITPLTMATLSQNPILVDFFNPENGEWNSHVKLGEWADLYLIAPATANTMAKMATGVADNLLLTTYLSARCDVAVAPAMDLDMYAHVATQRNMERLREDGVHIIEPGSGFLASGLVGKGRMAEPQDIVKAVEAIFAEKKKSLEGKRFLVTAGATIEPIDPVRFISNHSSGKMGYAVAEALAERGADVTLVSGRTALDAPKGVERVDVLSAEQMYEACVSRFEQMDGAVMCAAVADYTPQEVATEKLKKGDGDMSIPLKRTKDIAAALGERKGSRVLVGFAMETQHEMENAQSKLKRKNFDFIVLNSLRKAGAGFRGDTNIVTLIDGEGAEELPLMSKRDVADRIVDKIEKLL
ncbi:MAG: bifunctional phosphopantothenoylcysteine decarboxylase/phosphopantothenate--cysteine ligase CoaBC [Alistipes sp.]|jgi:phosphopantothenoylcysteine decarboxylase/phosphopantothenate--cysteine ligase|nr:bifunctional phosphopantothenoylcysteine decarboxylase/phosphopantothenate--cysteine ligase CoaBC [Alistipes sp.]MBQ6571445.1 bifunctional phosphopantothenoylcysteine decarboxylase/phosphopantothenate--cysteine ligase CoaBC [Alistipes sp.]